MHRALTPDAFDSLQSVLGVNGALDFGPLAGDQPGGEGTGKVCSPPRRISNSLLCRPLRAAAKSRRKFCSQQAAQILFSGGPLRALPPHFAPLVLNRSVVLY